MEKLIEIMLESGAASAALIKYECCEIINPKLSENIPFYPRSVFIGTIPYYTHYCDNNISVSAYALADDYHLYIKELGAKIITQAQALYPDAHFVCYGDHSPINEKLAAAKAGLGVIGEHSLLITPNHSSYIFLFEIISDLECDEIGIDIKHCEKCGKCINACPANIFDKGTCLSAITQKKGALSSNEISLIQASKCAWGCDICQQVCPHTTAAKASGTIYTDNLWFNSNVIENPTVNSIESVDFKSRAYAWRGKATITRNLSIIDSQGNGNEK